MCRQATVLDVDAIYGVLCIRVYVNRHVCVCVCVCVCVRACVEGVGANRIDIEETKRKGGGEGRIMENFLAVVTCVT